ncbi:MAG: hypothetical protein HQL09_00255 [Nitrospirae bacterium]|nr:hypothetical protein [Nitrospirota bacterium]
MKTLIRILFVLTMLLMVGVGYPAATSARVEVNIGIGIPVFSAPPELVVFPDTSVYVVPDYDVFFYHGYWYRPYGGRWYRSGNYNGPWSFIVRGRVPVSIINLPPDYRRRVWHERVPYGQVRQNWRGWERDRYWNARIERERHGGPEHREGMEHREKGEHGEGHREGRGEGHDEGHRGRD